MARFTHLNVHSCFSMMAGADRLETLFSKAKALGMEAIAVTDTNGLYGVVKAQRAGEAAGVRPIIGATVDQPEAPSRYAVALPKNMAGYGELCRLITSRQLDDDFDLAMATAGLSSNVIVLSSDPAVLEAGKLAGRDGSLYIELVNHNDTASRRRIAESLRLARRFELPVMATNNVHFAEPEGYKLHRILSAIRENTMVHTLPPGPVTPEAWLKPPEMMEALFAEIPEAIENTVKIADQLDFKLELGVTKFPRFTTPSGRSAAGYLREMAYEGALARYGAVTGEVKERVGYELRVIIEMGYADYFLVVHDIVKEARRRGIPTVGRGSAANSIVCYALEITDVCPIKLDLYFERFLNPERTDHPDIDIDFPWNRRDEIIEYVYEKYGRDHVAMISTLVTFRGRSIVRRVGKALDVPDRETDEFAKRVPSFWRISDVEEARRTIPECRGLPIDDEPLRTIIEIGKKIEGYPRGLSIHCGGIVISPCPITDLVPLQRAAKGINITQLDMYPVEDMGLVKIDLLGQRGLAVIADTMEDVEKHYGEKIDWAVIDPVKNPATREVMREGKTIGCFYIESPGMRSLLKKLKVEDFETLVAASSVIRPGVADSGMMKAFIDRSLGREEPVYLSPEMERLLKRTYGVLVYQEDVIKVANAVAGMSLAEADSLRKCMSKKRDWERMEKYKGRFISGAVLRGMERKTAQEVWRQVEAFGGYAFCKAHSASFAVLSWQSAYLKAHYLAEFMAAVIRNRGGFYNTSEYIEEARRVGVKILLPDVNKDEMDTVSTAIDGATRHNAVRIGLSHIKRLSHRAMDSIVSERGEGYTSLEDFLAHAHVYPFEAEILAIVGALDRFGGTRPELLWKVKTWSRSRHAKRREEGLTIAGMEREIEKLTAPSLPNYTLEEKLRHEREHFGFTVSAHPIELYRKAIPSGVIKAADLPLWTGKTIKIAGWLVHSKRTATVHHEYMKFLTLEDETGIFEATLFPRVYAEHGHLLHGRGPYVITGEVEEDREYITVAVIKLNRSPSVKSLKNYFEMPVELV